METDRAQRLNERLRGAGRANVGSDGFDLGLTFEVEETGNRAQRLNERLRGAGRANVEGEDFEIDIGPIDPSLRQAGLSSPPATADPAARYSPEISPDPPEVNESVPSRGVEHPFLKSPRRSAPYNEEITESPANAPGSGKRRRVPIHEAKHAADLMTSIMGEDPVHPISLPAINKPSQHSRPTAPRRGTASPVDQPSDESDDASDNEPMPPPRVTRPPQRPAADRSESPPSDEVEAREVSDGEAAGAIGRKRPHVSLEPSPELGSEESDAEPVEERPAPKRARPPPPARREPAVQRQPKKRNPAEGQNKKRGRPRKEAVQRASRARSGSADDEVIEVTVQRFVNGPDAESDEEGQGEISLANRNTETVVDVFAQVCEEVIASTLGKYEYLRQGTTDEAKKKDCRIKMRVLEAFGEEVSAQLLQHSIYLNHWYSLRKRIRHVQKEKLELRQEILRLKAEKEQVALRMDGVRARSEKEGNDSKHRLSASNLMHDIDMAVDQGREAAELSSRVRKEAELGNLELVISQLAENASSHGPTGGLLHQIQEFNALLERTATVLESR
ncbi:hypothetical protein PWT90_08022 [Aphanocladium album]|nr:hypothetical protein PWT90_08022 [Aphanocladium album]